MRLDGKVAIVTGSTKGIGTSIARVFATAGAQVVVTGRTRASGEQVVAQIRKDGGVAEFIAADLAVESDIEALVASAVDRFGGVDVLVNNAAPIEYIGEEGERPAADEPTEIFDYVMKVGIYAPFWCCKYAIPQMRQRGGGSIVNISSLASTEGLPSTPAYTCAKAALNGLTRQIAVDYAKDNVRSNCLVIGWILSGTLAHLIHDNPEFTEALSNAVPSRRWGAVEDIANAALFMAADQSAFVNGVCLPVDGGLHVRSATPDFAAMLGQLAAAGADGVSGGN